MGIDITLSATKVVEVHTSHITHSVAYIAKDIGLYYYIWGEGNSVDGNNGPSLAKALITPLDKAIIAISCEINTTLRHKGHKQIYSDYITLSEWCINLRKACADNPDAKISISK